MSEPTMSLDEFSERYIKPAMERLAAMEPEELIATAKRFPIAADLCDAVLWEKYGLVRESLSELEAG